MNAQEKLSAVEIKTLLQKWNDIIGTPHRSATLCRGGAGAPCHTPPGGGACSRCGYPRALAHPSSVLEGFRVEELWIGGTAIRVDPDRCVQPGIVIIFQTDGSSSEHSIPEDPDKLISPNLPEETGKIAAPAGQLLPEQIIKTVRRLTIATDLHNALDSFLSASAHQHESKFYETVHKVHALLRTALDQREALSESVRGPEQLIDDNRPNLGVAWKTVGPFAAPLSRLRIALLPGEADHVELYDIRVGETHYQVDTSIISRLPGYRPKTVREIPKRVEVRGCAYQRYIPGGALAGQLRNGADSSNPFELSPEDLLGGAVIDLGQTLPPMSYVDLFYRVMPGHVFYAVVEPLAPAPSQTPVTAAHALEALP